MKHFVLFLCLLLPAIITAQETTYQSRLKIENSRGEERFSVKFYPEKIKVEIPGKTLEAAKAIEKDKRKYREDGKTVAEIKYSDNGFKLRDSNGKLLWKVKIKTGRYDIADNEEMRSPYEIRQSGDQWSLRENGDEFAEVKWYADSKKLKLKESSGTEWYVAKHSRISPAIALAGCQRIWPVHQAILMAELEARQK